MVSILVLLDAGLPACVGAAMAVSTSSFDPCSPGCWSAGRLSAARMNRRTGFRSLFSWMLVCRRRRRCRIRRRRRVSILVLLDAGLPAQCFRSRGPGEHVSILVLLDAGLPGEPCRVTPRKSRGFDPCSPGCWSAGRRLWRLRSDGDEFRSLFSWMLVCRLHDVAETDMGVVFRSLFSWMLVCRVPGRTRPVGEFLVSILVLLDAGLPELVEHLRAVHREKVSILVLLDAGLPACQRANRGEVHLVSILVLLDAGLPALGGRRAFSATRCFDPCSPGCWSAGPDLGTRNRLKEKFRSLFSWMLVCRRLAMLDYVRLIAFRSLFSWMLVCRQDGVCPGRRRKGVSILVLLDAGLPDVRRGLHLLDLRRFRSLFSWMLVCRPLSPPDRFS